MDKYRLVLADDEEAIVQGLVNLFSLEEDLDVVATANDGERAVAAAREHRPDVVLMDYGMRQMDGIDAAARIREEAPGTQVVILSVYDDEALRDRAQRAGVSEWVTKSQPTDRILEAVRRSARATRGYAAHASLPQPDEEGS